MSHDTRRRQMTPHDHLHPRPQHDNMGHKTRLALFPPHRSDVGREMQGGSWLSQGC